MARNFDAASNDFIDFGDPAVLDLTGDEVTLSIWLRLGAAGTEMKVFAKWSDAAGDFSYLLSVLANNHALFAVFTGATDTVEGTTDLNDGEWHHVAGTYDGSDIRIYVDGVEEGSTAASGTMSSNTAPVRIGAGSGGSGTEEPFDGDLGHGALWDTARSAGNIRSLSEGISPRALSPFPLFYAPLNGQSPEADVIGGNTGTVTGTTVVEEPPIPNSIVAPG